jgi:hypothetical protein
MAAIPREPHPAPSTGGTRARAQKKTRSTMPGDGQLRVLVMPDGKLRRDETASRHDPVESQPQPWPADHLTDDERREHERRLAAVRRWRYPHPALKACEARWLVLFGTIVALVVGVELLSVLHVFPTASAVPALTVILVASIVASAALAVLEERRRKRLRLASSASTTRFTGQPRSGSGSGRGASEGGVVDPTRRPLRDVAAHPS